MILMDDDDSLHVNFSDHCTGDHLMRRDTADDDGIPVDAAAVMLAKATGWFAVYPKASKSMPHTIEAMQHFAGAKYKSEKFDCDNAPELVAGARHCK